MTARDIRSAALLLLLLLGTLMLGVNCTPSTIYLNPNPGFYISSPPINVSVGLLIDPMQAQQVHSTGFSLLAGGTVGTGLALRTASENTFRKLFTKVEVLSNRDEFTGKQLTLLITPSITRFSISQDVTAELFLYCKIVDQAGKTVYEKTIPARGSTQGGLAYIGGGYVRENVLSTTSTEAFNQAFSMLGNDIAKNADFSPYLKK